MKRFRRFLRQHYAYGPLIGLVSTTVGVLLGYRGHPYWLALLAGIGTSLIAAGLVTYLSPENDVVYQQFLALGIRELWPSRRDIPSHFWCQWVREARKTCILLGVAHAEWRRDERFEPALRTCLTENERLAIEIFFLDPTSAMAEARAQEEQRNTPGMIKESINIIWGIRGRLDERQRDRLKLYVYDATPSSGATWIDDFMLVTHYLAGYPNRTSPAFKVEDVGPDSLYTVYAHNIDMIRERASTREITGANLASYT